MKLYDQTQEKGFMREALLLAEEAKNHGDVPVGCVIVCENQIVGRGMNRRELNFDATAHAEVEAIREASQSLKRWRLDDCRLFVTLEPCAMCSGAILNAKIHSVYYGAREEKTGCCGSVLNLFFEPLGHKPRVYGGLLEEESKILLEEFFENIRKNHR